jgi:hypothetical protein
MGDKFPKHIYHSIFVSAPWSLTTTTVIGRLTL